MRWECMRRGGDEAEAGVGSYGVEVYMRWGVLWGGS